MAGFRSDKNMVRNITMSAFGFVMLVGVALAQGAAPAAPQAPMAGGNRSAQGGNSQPQYDCTYDKTEKQWRCLPQPEQPGFISIFNGKDLSGWDGNPNLWRVVDGVIVGETKPDDPIKENQFLIWRGGEPADFILKLEYRVSIPGLSDPQSKRIPCCAGNGGVQYRSFELPGAPGRLHGYQSDIDAPGDYTGKLVDERGRHSPNGYLDISLRGDFGFLAPGESPQKIASLGDRQELRRWFKNDDWNEIEIFAYQGTLVHIYNGHVMALAIDADDAVRQKAGLIGIQLHVGPPVKLEVRNIRLKNLSPQR